MCKARGGEFEFNTLRTRIFAWLLMKNLENQVCNPPGGFKFLFFLFMDEKPLVPTGWLTKAVLHVTNEPFLSSATRYT